MRSSTLNFRIEDDQELIPLAIVKSFKIYSSIHSSYPIGELILDDKEGRLLSELAIRPGAVMRIEAIDEDGNTTIAALNGNTSPSDSPSYYMTPMMIVGVENPEEDDNIEFMMMEDTPGRTSTLGGQVRVYLAHPWAVYSDWKNKAWKEGTQISKIVKEIVQQSTGRGFAFSGFDLPKSETDDTKGPPRYKLQESEAEFITRKLLPYASLGKQPMYAFVDEQNKFHFQTFENLYNDNEPELSLVPPLTEAVREGESLLSNAINPHEILDGNWYIGRKFKEQLGVIKKNLYIEDSDARTSFKALSRYRTPIAGSTLLKKGFLSAVDITSSEVIPFRFFGDGVRLSANRNRVMNEFFELSLITSLCFNQAAIGKTVDLRLLSTQGHMDDSEDSPQHWANGKWLVMETEHFLMEKRPYSKLLLARPAIELPGSLDPSEYYILENK